MYEKSLLKICMKLKLLNVIIIYKDFFQKPWFLTYLLYPKFTLRNITYAEGMKIYMEPVVDFQGKQLNIGVSWALPDMVFTYEGKNKVRGIYGELLNLYGKKYNLTLNISMDHDHGRLFDNLKNSSFDFIMTVQLVNPNDNVLENFVIVSMGYYGVALPVERAYTKGEMMLPQEPKIVSILSYIVGFLIWILINLAQFRKIEGRKNMFERLSKLEWFRGIIGSPVVLPKQPGFTLMFIYYLLIFDGYFNQAFYSANLNYKFTKMPKLSPVNSFEELVARGSPKIIKSDTLALDFLFDGNETEIKNYASVFYNVKNTSEMELASKMFSNTQYGYSVYTKYWPLIESIQNRYKNKIFTLVPNMNYRVILVFGFVFSQGSIFEVYLQKHISNVFRGGLPNFWHYFNSFKLVKYVDDEPEPIRLSDIYGLMLLCLRLHCVSFFVFLCEILFFKIKRRFGCKRTTTNRAIRVNKFKQYKI